MLVDARKRLEPGVAGERYKPVCSVDRPLHLSFFKLTKCITKSIVVAE